MAQVDRDRLRALVNESGRSARAISLAANLGATAVKDILSGKSRAPGAGTMATIAAELGVPVSELMSGLQPNPAAESPGSLTHVKLAPRFLPVRYWVQAGLWREIDAEEPPEQITLAVLPDPRFSQFPQWLEKVVGDSVDKRIPADHYAHVVDAVELGYAPSHGDWVVVERRRDQGAVRERTIKQVEVACGRVTLWPRSHNPKWSDPVELTAGTREGEDVEVQVVGLVIGAYDLFK
jgi:transcriptional regulator with XRE-family HTH domain